MVQITAALVKELRERTGSGMMECKKALQESHGDIEAAIELMRKAGLAKADKKAGRIAAEGLIAIRQADDAKTIAMVEVNCETDFVAKGEDFQQFANALADLAVHCQVADLSALLELPLDNGQPVEQVRRELIAKLGENITVRRITRFTTNQGLLNSYSHSGRIGVLVEMENASAELAKDIAMHVAASKPLCIDANEVPAELIAKERDIFTAQAAGSGKPADIVERIVAGRLRKYLEEVTLLGQPFVKDPDHNVAQLLQKANARVVRFARFELGEGIEKRADDFVSEVMAQARGS
jgi:elongation factor Ts